MKSGVKYFLGELEDKEKEAYVSSIEYDSFDVLCRGLPYWLVEERRSAECYIGHGKIVRRVNETLDNYCASVFVCF